MSGPPFSQEQILKEQIENLKELVKAQEFEISSLSRRLNEAITSKLAAVSSARSQAFYEVSKAMRSVQYEGETVERAVIRNLKELKAAIPAEDIGQTSYDRGQADAYFNVLTEMNLTRHPSETAESAVLRKIKEMRSAPSTEEVEDMSHVRGKIEAYCEVAKALGMDIEATDVNKDNVISEIEAMMSKLSILKDVDFGILGRYVSAVRNLKEKRECLKLAKDRLDDIQIETSRAGDVVQNLRAALTSGFEDKKDSE